MKRRDLVAFTGSMRLTHQRHKPKHHSRRKNIAMHTIQTRERTDRDGALSLRIPLGKPDTEFEVVVVVQSKASADTPPLPPGYFDLLGSIDDETFIIHPQPPLPPPLEVE